MGIPIQDTKYKILYTELLEEAWDVEDHHTYDNKHADHFPDSFEDFLVFFLK